MDLLYCRDRGRFTVMTNMDEREEPSYLAFARAAVRTGEGVSATIARELIARIDRDEAALRAGSAK